MPKLSKIEEEFLTESNLIERESKNITQAALAWEFVRDSPELTHGVIMTGHKILMIDKPYPPPLGWYRNMQQRNPTIGGRIAPHWGMVEGLMDNWLLDYKDLGWKAAHIRFEYIHPFCDGNGRIGRILMNWQRLKEGLPILVIHHGDEQDKYYEWFRK